MGGPYRRLLVALLLFTLGNSTDAFLLLRLSDAGLTAGSVALLWSGLHVVKMLASWWGGRWSDRSGRRAAMIAGWLVYAAVYLGFALATTEPALIAIFLVYGLYFGLTEPVEKAWVVDLVPAPLRGTALGGYHFVVGLAALPASLLFGLLWTRVSPFAAFTTGAALALAAALLLLRVRTPDRPRGLSLPIPAESRGGRKPAKAQVSPSPEVRGRLSPPRVAAGRQPRQDTSPRRSPTPPFGGDLTVRLGVGLRVRGRLERARRKPTGVRRRRPARGSRSEPPSKVL